MISQQDLTDTLRRLVRFYPMHGRELHAVQFSRDALDRIRSALPVENANQLWHCRTELLRIVESTCRELAL